MGYWPGYFLILFLVGGGLIMLLLHLHRGVISRPFLENLTLMGLAIFITLMGVEFYFKVFFDQTDSLDTLARQNWRERYYTGTFNSWGFRDIQWTDEMVAGKIKVMVVGDSFVEGAGIEYTRDRFPDRLAQKLGPDYVVFNLGKAGTNTSQQIQAIINYPYAPDILVLSYFINDIQGVVGEKNWINRPPGLKIPPLLSPLVKNSYAFNFFFWRVVRLLQSGQPDAQWLWLLRVYNDPDAWWRHQQELLSIYEGARSQRIPLFVVVFPSMDYTEASQVVTERIINLFREQGVPVLDVADLIKDIPVSERIASPVDTHSSELVHARVADALYEMFVEAGLAR